MKTSKPSKRSLVIAACAAVGASLFPAGAAAVTAVVAPTPDGGGAMAGVGGTF